MSKLFGCHCGTRKAIGDAVTLTPLCVLLGPDGKEHGPMTLLRDTGEVSAGPLLVDGMALKKRAALEAFEARIEQAASKIDEEAFSIKAFAGIDREPKQTLAEQKPPPPRPDGLPAGSAIAEVADLQSELAASHLEVERQGARYAKLETVPGLKHARIAELEAEVGRLSLELRRAVR